MDQDTKQAQEYGSLPTYSENAVFESAPDTLSYRSRMKWIKMLAAAAVAVWLTYYFLMVLPFTSTRSIKIPELQRVKILDYNVYAPSHETRSKLILVGDVHGHLGRLEKVLAKANFRPRNADTLVVLGDFISKGPKSIETLNYLMKLRKKYGNSTVECVRGNHEHAILTLYAKYHNLPAPPIKAPNLSSNEDLSPTNNAHFLSNNKGAVSDQDIVRHLKPAHIEFLSSCPAIISLPNVTITHNKMKSKISRANGVVMAHGGLQWDIPTLEEQDPITVMNIRSLLPPSYHEASSLNAFSKEILETYDPELGNPLPWVDMWVKYQKTLPESERQLVYYGHNAADGLNLREFTRGLDSGCTKGNRLTTAVITQRSDLTFEETVISVNC
ncbi:Metallo-dependent phosphatase [Nadsonia fulvescens var. elongata DSM 6958]|uniref:Metallo-dependent phosphatase n=1 Tax=Nadsonia fulvescens var. elongata DSM 6958 TaxID=857566 RepID=A0A1E3PJ01_9ASCO|nr:Metallo-dependent phosphatase [Nadsonia fulvescens var. elongata DSM 6958]